VVVTTTTYRNLAVTDRMLAAAMLNDLFTRGET
jgi:hypothetical protein